MAQSQLKLKKSSNMNNKETKLREIMKIEPTMQVYHYLLVINTETGQKPDDSEEYSFEKILECAVKEFGVYITLS